MNKKHIFSLFVTALICILAFCAPASFASDGELVAVYKTTGEYGFAKYGFAGRKARAGCGRSTRCADNADEDQSRDQWHTDTFAGEGKAGICRSV